MRWQGATRLALALIGAAGLGCDGPEHLDAGAPDAGAPDAGRAAFVAEETADEAALALLADLDGLPVLGTDRVIQLSSEDRGDGGPVDLPLLENGNRDMNHFVCPGAELDLREPNLVEVLFDEERCAEGYVRGAVMARVEGSGALVRLWMTLWTITDAPPDRERLLVWVDDDPEPVIDAPLAEVIDGSASPIFEPPFGAGARDHLAWYYPVVFGSKLIVALDGIGPLDLVYHQSTVRLDATPSPRAAPAEALPARASAAAALEERALDGAPSVADVTLMPSEIREVLSLAGPATIRALRARGQLDGVILRIRWDGAPDPAIELPLRELFAAALDPPDPGSPQLLVDGDALVLRLPMPFETGASVELENRGAADAALELIAHVEDGVPARPFGRLHVDRRETVAPATGPHPLVDAAGPGRLVGVCLMMEGRGLPGGGLLSSPLNFLEGDERFVVDGVTSITGTGTEDYLDGAFYFEDGPIAGPFAQAWGAAVEGEVGRASGCRWHLRTHAMDFATSLTGELEIGPGAPDLLERYRSVAFVYR